MSEHDQAQPVLGAELFSVETLTAGELREFRRTHCAQCDGPFGLIRRRHAGKQFCSAACVAEYTADMRDRARPRSHWYDFLFQGHFLPQRH